MYGIKVYIRTMLGDMKTYIHIILIGSTNLQSSSGLTAMMLLIRLIKSVLVLVTTDIDIMFH